MRVLGVAQILSILLLGGFMSLVFSIGGAFIVLSWLWFIILKDHHNKNSNTDKCSDNKLPMSTPEDSRKVKKKS